MKYLFTRVTFWCTLAGLLLLIHFIRGNITVAPMQEPVFTPPRKPFAKSIGASGIIEAMHENIYIGVPVSGIIKEVTVTLSQKVAKGDVLLLLDDREVSAKLIGQRSEIAIREAELSGSQRRFDRLAKIGAGNAVSQEEIDNRQDDLLLAKANLQKAKASLEETNLLLDRYVVRAPISGTIIQINFRAGEHISTGAITPPIIIGSLDELQISVDVDEQSAALIKPNAKAIAYRKGENSEPIELKFVRIEPFIIPKKSLTGSSSERIDTRILPVIFSFTNQESAKIYVGQQVDVFIEE